MAANGRDTIVKSGGFDPPPALFKRSSPPLRGRGIAWLQHHRYDDPDAAYRRFALPWATLVVTLGTPGRWRKPGGSWKNFPRLALRGHATSWSEGCDAPGCGAEYAAVLIEPWAVQSIFGVPAAAVANDVVDLESLWGPRARDLLGRIADCRDPRDRLALLQHTLMVSAEARAVDPRVALFIRLCRRRAGGLRLNVLAPLWPASSRRFREIFGDAIGVSPKRWACLERFSASVQELHPTGWGIASQLPLADYFDQAHAIHEFRRHAGITPGAYRRSKSGGDPRLFMVLESELASAF